MTYVRHGILFMLQCEWPIELNFVIFQNYLSDFFLHMVSIISLYFPQLTVRGFRFVNGVTFIFHWRTSLITNLLYPLTLLPASRLQSTPLVARKMSGISCHERGWYSNYVQKFGCFQSNLNLLTVFLRCQEISFINCVKWLLPWPSKVETINKDDGILILLLVTVNQHRRWVTDKVMMYSRQNKY